MALLDQFDGDVPDTIETDTEPIRCIHCGEDEDVAWGRLDAEANNVWRENECNVCGTYWQEVYTIQCLTRITIGEKLGS